MSSTSSRQQSPTGQSGIVFLQTFMLQTYMAKPSMIYCNKIKEFDRVVLSCVHFPSDPCSSITVILIYGWACRTSRKLEKNVWQFMKFFLKGSYRNHSLPHHCHTPRDSPTPSGWTVRPLPWPSTLLHWTRPFVKAAVFGLGNDPVSPCQSLYVVCQKLLRKRYHESSHFHTNDGRMTCCQANTFQS